VKDAERIYALYVQANPVPNSDLLDATRDEAVLLPIEGSEDMITQEPIERSPRVRPSRRNMLVAAGAFSTVLIAGLVTVLLVMGGDSRPVAAIGARPEVVFDGTTCIYDGPTKIEVGVIEFTMVNSADEEFTLAAWRMKGEQLEAELSRLPIGSDIAVTTSDHGPTGVGVGGWITDPGSTRTGSAGFASGTYLIDCVTTTGGSSDHAWRTAQIEVVAP
jgi:hypothetical protein